MKRVFADSLFYIALLNSRDQFHDRAKQACTEEAGDFVVTTTWVLAEVADAMTHPSARERCAGFLRNLRHLRNTKIVDGGQVMFWRALELFSKRPDKEWSLTDCISFIVMSDEGLTEALTGDRHFEQAGFTALLRD